MLNTSSIPFRINFLSQNLLTLALSPASFLHGCTCCFFFFFFVLWVAALRKRQRKREKKWRHAAWLQIQFMTFPDSVFHNLEEVTLATMTLSASEVTLSFLMIISFWQDDFLQIFFFNWFSSWSFLQTNLSPTSEYLKAQLKQTHRQFRGRTAPWCPQWAKVLPTSLHRAILCAECWFCISLPLCLLMVKFSITFPSKTVLP